MSGDREDTMIKEQFVMIGQDRFDYNNDNDHWALLATMFDQNVESVEICWTDEHLDQIRRSRSEHLPQDRIYENLRHVPGVKVLVGEALVTTNQENTGEVCEFVAWVSANHLSNNVPRPDDHLARATLQKASGKRITVHRYRLSIVESKGTP